MGAEPNRLMIAYATRKCALATLTIAALLIVAAFVASSSSTGPDAGVWLGNAMHLDFGHTADGASVDDSIGAALPASALLAAVTWAITLICGWGGGLLLAVLRSPARGISVRRGPIRNWIQGLAAIVAEGLAIVATVGQAMPIFWVGGLLIALCSVGTGWLPPGGIAAANLPAFGTDSYHALFQAQPASVVSDLLAHLALPAITLALVGIATDLSLIRGIVPAELRTMHAQAARAAGLSRWRLLRRAGKPCLPIILAGAASTMPIAVSGLILVEYLYAWPGIGLLAYHAAREGDMATLAALLTLFGTLVTAVNLVADVLSAWLDPRRHEPQSVA